MSEDLLFHMSDVACVRASYDNGWKEIHEHLLKLCQDTENNGWKKRTGMTQHSKILNHIRKNGSITQREAYIDYSIQNFTARISELRDLGFNIVRLNKRHPVTGQPYSRYYLTEGMRASKNAA
jgi:hypothetical protein